MDRSFLFNKIKPEQECIPTFAFCINRWFNAVEYLFRLSHAFQIQNHSRLNLFVYLDSIRQVNWRKL